MEEDAELFRWTLPNQLLRCRRSVSVCQYKGTSKWYPSYPTRRALGINKQYLQIAKWASKVNEPQRTKSSRKLFFLLATYERTFNTHFLSKRVPFHLGYEQYKMGTLLNKYSRKRALAYEVCLKEWSLTPLNQRQLQAEIWTHPKYSLHSADNCQYPFTRKKNQFFYVHRN